jgi:predicted ribosome quality control (RQC) complex YloA/Tae2 family protein
VQNSYFLIRQLVPALKNKLEGSVLNNCFSQNRNELVLRFTGNRTDEFTIIAHLDPGFTCLAFPKEYHKKKKNTAPIFNALILKKVIDVSGFVNERAFQLHFDHQYSLIFKMFGHQSNVLLVKKSKVVSIFRNSQQKDYNLPIDKLDRLIDQSEEAVLKNLEDLKNVYPTLDKITRNTICERISGLNNAEAVLQIKKFIKQLENPTSFYLIEHNQQLKMSIVPTNNIIAQFTSPLDALTAFFKRYLKENKFKDARRVLLKNFEQQIKSTEAYIKKAKSKVNSLQNETNYRKLADLLMANLHLLDGNTSSVELPDFYSRENILVKLNPRLNGQQNAEKYYNKAKNVVIEISKLKEAISSKMLLINQLKKDIENIREATSMSDLQVYYKTKVEAVKDKLPFKKFSIDGYIVLVGNNAKQNDLLTLKYAKKDDLFFHAKDVAGSHVILKQISGINVPAITLEKTAALAAHYSKRKTDSLCPVGYTTKKYVRKPKGAQPGMVLVEREQVILVKPGLPQ